MSAANGVSAEVDSQWKLGRNGLRRKFAIELTGEQATIMLMALQLSHGKCPFDNCAPYDKSHEQLMEKMQAIVSDDMYTVMRFTLKD